MCRLIALPPGTVPEKAHELVSNFVRGNDDGVGEAYVVKGEFKVNKYPYSYNEAVTKKNILFQHMPSDSWTIAHVRLSTHGKNEWRNTHPFVKGDVAVVHNGIFGHYSLIKAALGGSVKWSGETDSEVAAYLYSKLGPNKFFEEMPKFGSVYLGLKRDGSLSAVKFGSGDLRLQRLENDTFILASEFPWKEPYYACRDAAEGVLKLDKEGHAENFQFQKKQETKDFSQSARYFRGMKPSTSGGISSCSVGGANFTSEDIYDPSKDHSARKASGTTSNIPLIGNVKKKKVLDLWNGWPSEDDLMKLGEEDFT